MTIDQEASPPRTEHRMLIVDGHPIVYEGLTKLIAHVDDLEVCGCADNAADALRQVIMAIHSMRRG